MELEVKLLFLWPSPIQFPLQCLLKTVLYQWTHCLLRQLFPFKQLSGVIGASFFGLKAASSGSHSLVLTLGLGIGPANLNPCYQCILHVCEASSYILSESSCLQMKLLWCFDFSSCDRMSWPTVTYHHMSSAQVPLTGGIPR